ncbi:MAG: polyhydroxyalkanoate depolymerase [Ancalomicrobiaceae bacterium]|nr:polyhydroxyalkanoate depolymerase [Ancalomicrobiaceae bacterium]
MFYQLFEMNHAALGPWRAAADVTRLYFKNPLNPLAHTHYGKSIAAACEVFERSTRRYGKPEFGLPTSLVGGARVAVAERIVWEKPFARLIHFERDLPAGRRPDPKILLVAPMSGHYATLLRGTVEALMPRHEVYITDWIDARMVPLTAGGFDLDDYVDYVIDMLHHLGEDTHVIAVCQPSVPVLAAVALMEEANDRCAPRSMILMGGPVDTRISPTAVNKLVVHKDLDWFRRNVIMQVPFPHPGFMRAVYPGFLQLSGFMSMNLDRHLNAQREFYGHLIEGDGDSAEKHRDFYDEYLAVMDLSAEFYLQTVDTVFIRHSLPLGEMLHRGRKVDPSAIHTTALLTVEGELDDITGKGQTQAAHRLCANIPDVRRADYVQPQVGHYGVFNGSRFRAEIAPRIADFVMTFNRRDARLSETAAPVQAALKAKELEPEAEADSAIAGAPAAAGLETRPAVSAAAAPVQSAPWQPTDRTAEPAKPATARRKPAPRKAKPAGVDV